MSVAIITEELSKSYRIGELQSTYGTLRDSLAAAAKRLVHRDHRPHHEEIWALRDVSLEVPEGQVLGVIGRNGAGKSTLLRILTRITTPTSGRAEIRGRVGSLLEVGTGFHPELTGRENVFLNGSVLGMKQREIQGKFDEIVEFAGVEQFIDTPVKRYSSGMSVRLAFAVAAHLEPEILLVDEVLAVGDAEFQRRCLGRMEDLSESGRTVVFVSHQMQAVAQLCDRAILLEKGRVTRDGPSGDVVAHYLQRVGGSRSTRSWPDVEHAPGDDLARLLSVRVVDESGTTVDAANVRRPSRRRDRLPRPSLRRTRRLPKDQGLERPAQRRVQRAGHELAVARSVAAGRVRVDRVDTRQPPQRGARHGRRRNLLTQCAEAPPTCAAAWTPSRSTSRTTVKDDSARGLFTGQLQGVVRPLLEWTTADAEGQASANRVGGSSSSNDPLNR